LAILLKVSPNQAEGGHIVIPVSMSGVFIGNAALHKRWRSIGVRGINDGGIATGNMVRGIDWGAW
jgi:hypothetical protein